MREWLVGAGWGELLNNTFKTVNIVNLPCGLLSVKKLRVESFLRHWKQSLLMHIANYQYMHGSLPRHSQCVLYADLCCGSLASSKCRHPFMILLCFASLYFPAFVLTEG